MQIPLVPFLFFVVACINTGIGVHVLLHAPLSKANQSFFIFSLGSGMWIGGFGLLLITHNSIFIPILNLGGVFLLAGLFRVSLLFSNVSSRVPSLFYIPFVIGAGIALYPELLIQDVTYTAVGALPVQGPWFPFYSAGFAIYTVVSLGILITAYRRAVRTERKRLQYFFLGIGIFIGTTTVCDLILPALGIFDLNFAGPLSSVVSLVATGYAIVRHRLMDIRIIIQRSLIYSAVLGVIIGLYVALAMTMEYVFIASENIDGFIAGVVTTVCSSFGIPVLLQFFRRVTDPIFFKDSYNYAEALETLSVVLNSNLDESVLITQSLEVLQSILRPRYAYFVREKTKEWFDAGGVISPDSLPIVNRSDDRVCVVQVKADGHALGEYILGPKRSGDPYTEEDCTLLRTFASQAMVAFQKAELYQELRNQNETLEETVEERTRDVRKMVAQKSEEYDDISHALLTPLTVLKSAVELLKSGRAAPDTTVYVNMERSVDDLSNRARSLINLSRIGPAYAESTVELFDISACLSRIVEYVGTIAHEQDILLTKDIQTSLMVRGNQKQIEEVITNLLSNALRYTKESAVSSIHITLMKSGGTIILTVKDTGIGIAPDELKHLYDRFYRAENTRENTSGFGLGLAITKRIVNSHNGTIGIESALGIGTTITVRLPCP
jgi:signal transduction histidine kinase